MVAYQLSGGATVHLDGAFQTFTGANGEGTKGYSLKVEGATLTTYDRYLETYGVEPAEPGTNGDQTCVVDVTVRVRNEGTGQGGLDVFNMVLVPERANEYYICDVLGAKSLWPQVQKGASPSVSIKPGTEYVMHLPYVTNTSEELTYASPIHDTRFTLLVSRMPVRKMISVEVTS